MHRLATIAAMAVLIASSGCAGPDGPGSVPPGVDDLDDYAQHLREESFSGAVRAVRGGDTVVAEGFGLADRTTDRPNETTTAFDVGSIAKTFTAATVLRLADQGALSLDDTIGDHLDDVPVDKQEITLRQLLNFQSGLHEYHDHPGEAGDFEPMTREEARDRILGQDLRFAPGSDTAYSNSSYTLAAIVVEQVTGRGFTEVVDELVDAAGLTRTGFYGSPSLADVPVAVGHEGQTHEDNDPTSWEVTWSLLGAGGMVATVEDMQTWWDQLSRPGLLSPASAALVRDELFPVDTVEGVEVRAVGGANDFGFEAILISMPAVDVVIAVATNANPPDRTLATDAGVVLARLMAG